MKTMNKLTIAVTLLLGLACSAFGQTALTQTTLAAAVATSSTTTVRLASVTGVVANSTILYFEDGSGGPGEAMFVNSVSGTAVGVTRGYNGTPAKPHINTTLVLLGPTSAFLNAEPTGSCTNGVGQAAFAPAINLKTGNQWLCSSISGQWIPGFFNASAPAGVSTAVASVAGATNPSGPLFHITGALAITAWGTSTTVGAVGMGGGSSQPIGAPFCTIPDAAFTTTATNNIATAVTAVANLMICWTFDATNKKYIALQSK
jgi:hypothetical protein